MNATNSNQPKIQQCHKKWSYVGGLLIRNNHNAATFEIKSEYRFTEDKPRGVVICEGKRKNNIPYNMIDFNSSQFATLSEKLHYNYPETFI